MTIIIIFALACIGTIIFTLIKPQIIFLPALLGALALLFFGLLPWSEAVAGLTANSDINPLKILTLFLTIALLSVLLDEAGFFNLLAYKTAQKYKGRQIWPFIIFYIIVSIIATFTPNYMVIILFTPFICYFSKNAKIDPIPYLVSEFVAANTSSMFLIIGNPTNTYLATMAGIDSSTYLNAMVLPATLASITVFIVLFVLFHKPLKQPINFTPEKVTIKIKPIKLLSAVVFRVPWDIIPFVISMSIIVLALENSGATEKIAELLNLGNNLFIYGIGSTLAANLMNNIPMSVLFSSLLNGSEEKTIAIYATVIGSNIGAYLTPIASLAGIMWFRILRNQGIKYDFVQFLSYGIYVAIPTLLVALLGLLFAETQNISLDTLSMTDISAIKEIFGIVIGVVVLVIFIELLFFQKLRKIFETAKKQKTIDTSYNDIFKKQKAIDSIYMGIWWGFIFISGIFLYMFALFQTEKAETQTLFSYIFSKIAISIDSSIRMFTWVFPYDRVSKVADSNWIYHAALVLCYMAAVFWAITMLERLFLRRITNELRLWWRTNKFIMWIRSKLSLVNDYQYIIVGCENSMKAFLADLQKTVNRDNIIIITGIPNDKKDDSNAYFKKIIEAGYVAIDGKADEEALENAGIDNATMCKIRVIAITESDKQNLTVAHIITEKIKANENINLEAYIMYSSIEGTEYFVFAEEAHGKVDFFNPYELRARAFFEKHPIIDSIPQHFIDTKKARLDGEFKDGKIYKEAGKEYIIKNIFIGFGATNYQMLKGSILTGQLLGCAYYATIYDEKTFKRQAILKNHSSGLFSGSDEYKIVFNDENILSRDFYISLIKEIDEESHFTTIYIALGKDQLNVETACEIRQYLYENEITKDKVRIFVKICEKTVFSKDSVINHKKYEENFIPIECFGWNISVFTKDYIVNESLDKFAKAVTNKNHEKSWERLTETQRDINRQVAISIKTKLHLLGLDLKDKTEEKVNDDDYYKDYIGEGNEEISKIIELSKEIASLNNEIEKLYEQTKKDQLMKRKTDRSNYILNYIKYDNNEENGDISDTPRNNLARLEHLRWNTFYLVNGWTKMPISDVGAGNSGRQNKLTKQHACITTFEGLIELRKLQAEKMHEEDPKLSLEDAERKADTIWYDYSLMDELPIRLQNSEKVICKKSSQPKEKN